MCSVYMYCIFAVYVNSSCLYTVYWIILMTNLVNTLDHIILASKGGMRCVINIYAMLILLMMS